MSLRQSTIGAGNMGRALIGALLSGDNRLETTATPAEPEGNGFRRTFFNAVRATRKRAGELAR